MTAIGYLDTSQKINSILREFFLVRLLTYQKDIDQSGAVSVGSTTSFGKKRTTWTINQMMS